MLSSHVDADPPPPPPPRPNFVTPTGHAALVLLMVAERPQWGTQGLLQWGTHDHLRRGLGGRPFPAHVGDRGRRCPFFMSICLTRRSLYNGSGCTLEKKKAAGGGG